MPGRLIVIASYPTTIEADIARMRLADAGIAACLSDETVVANLAIRTNAVMGVKLLVVESEVARAREILNDHEAEDQAARLSGRNESWTCIHCGALVEGAFAVCWSCGTSQSGERDPTFTADDAEPLAADDSDTLDDGQDERSSAFESVSRVLSDDANPYRAPIAEMFPAKRSVKTLDEEVSADGDATVLRAWRAAVFGLLFCPPILNIYSAFLLISVAVQSQELSRRGNRYYFWAWVFNVLSVVWSAYFLEIYVL